MTARARDLVVGQWIRTPDGWVVEVVSVLRIQGGTVCVIGRAGEHWTHHDYASNTPVEVIDESPQV